MFVKSNPIFYSGFVKSLQNNPDKVSFSSRYSRFKKKCHCQSLHQVVKISSQHLSREENINDLKQVLEGLRTIKQEYPKSGILKRVMAYFNRQYRESRNRALDSLNNTIQAYERKINVLETDKNRVNTKETPIEGELNEAYEWVMAINNIDSIEEHGWSNVRVLLLDEVEPRKVKVPFTEAATGALKRIAESGKLPPSEHLALWKKELNALGREFGNGEIQQDEIFAAMLLAGREHAPEFIRQMDRIKHEEPGLLYPDISRRTFSRQARMFRNLAETVEVVIGKKAAIPLDFKGDKYVRPKEVSEIKNPIVDLKISKAREIVSRMLKDNRRKSPQEALQNLTSKLLAQLEGSKKDFTEDNIKVMAKLFVVSLANDSGNAFSAFAMLLERSLSESELSHFDTPSRQMVDSLVDALAGQGEIDLSQIKSKNDRALELISQMAKEGFSRAEEELNGINKPMLGEEIELNETIEGREDFSDFVARLLEVSRNGRSKEGLVSLSGLFHEIDEYWKTFGSPDPDQFKKALMYQLQAYHPDKFAQFVLDILLIRELNPELSHSFLTSLCQAIGYAGGIDLLKISVIEEVLDMENVREDEEMSEEIKIFEENLDLFKVHNEWLAKMDLDSPPKDVKLGEIEDAVKLQRLFDHPEFKDDVEILLNRYLMQKTFSSTYDNRRVYVEEMTSLMQKYCQVMEPGVKKLGADSLILFAQTLLAVHPDLGAKVLVKVAHEDISVLEDILNTPHWTYFTLHSLRGIFIDSDKFLKQAFPSQKKI